MLDRAVSSFSAVAAVALVLMVGITFADVILSKAFRSPLPGSYELVALAQVVAISLAGADALRSGRHVRVEILVEKFPQGLRRGVIALAAALGVVLFGVAAWEGFSYGLSLLEAGEVTGTVKVPLYPFAFVLGFGGVLLVLLLWRELVAALKGG